VPEVRPGTVLGHEAVGEIVEAGRDVHAVQPGERVLVSCITACGRCGYCWERTYGQCRGGGGWTLGHVVDGTQAEYVRVPHADLSVHALPGTVDSKDAVLLADIFPTAYEVGVLNGHVRPGDSVVVVGAGPIGLAAIATARLFAPGRIVAVDLAATRLEAAKQLGADALADAAEAPDLIADLTDGLGADVAIEAVGEPESFELCTRAVRPGGHVANVGVHGRPVTLHLEDLWSRNVTITTGLVDTYSTPTLLRMAAAGRLPTSTLVTHTFPLDQMEEAYDVFGRGADTGALKVVLGGQQHEVVAVRAA
jgi:alcohol dehydrogenase